MRQDKKYRRCLSSALRVTITSKGVFPCSYHRGNLKLNYNPRRDYDSLDEILSYPHLPEVNPSVDCPFFCARHYANLSLESQLKTLTDDKLFTPNKDWDLFLWFIVCPACISITRTSQEQSYDFWKYSILNWNNYELYANHHYDISHYLRTKTAQRVRNHAAQPDWVLLCKQTKWRHRKKKAIRGVWTNM